MSFPLGIDFCFFLPLNFLCPNKPFSKIEGFNHGGNCYTISSKGSYRCWVRATCTVDHRAIWDEVTQTLWSPNDAIAQRVDVGHVYPACFVITLIQPSFVAFQVLPFRMEKFTGHHYILGISNHYSFYSVSQLKDYVQSQRRLGAF